MRKPPIFAMTALAATLLVSLACSRGPEPEAESSGPAAQSGPESASLASRIPYGAEPFPGILTGGQPSKEEFEELAKLGLRTVVNLRVPTERGTRDEPAWMEELGLEYVSIPVAGAAGITEEAARDLDRTLESVERPVLVHCGSSNRVGAVFALRAFYVEGQSSEESLAIGKAAGVTKLEGRVQELLEQ